MGFSDIFKKSFLEGYSSTEITFKNIVVCMAITLAISAYIFIIYRLLTRKSFYDKNFNISLVAMSLITAAVILTVQSSVVISLGMVGALSIVRFRTAIKDPMDLVFLFWSISVGIICGAGLAQIAAILSLVLTVGLIVFNHLPVAKAPMILVINADRYEAEVPVMNCIKEYSKYNKIKSKNMKDNKLDMVIEVRVNSESEMMGKLMQLNGVTSVSLLSHDGEVTF